jgi:hypothetical protein
MGHAIVCLPIDRSRLPAFRVLVRCLRCGPRDSPNRLPCIPRKVQLQRSLRQAVHDEQFYFLAHVAPEVPWHLSFLRTKCARCGFELLLGPFAMLLYALNVLLTATKQ